MGFTATKSFRQIFTIFIFMGLFFGRWAHGRELQGRLGLGFNTQFSNLSTSDPVGLKRPAGISMKYGFTRDIALEFIAGAALATPTNVLVGAKFFKNIFYETHLNFYATAGGALLVVDGTTGFEFQGGVGVEFFIPGIDSLGFSTEVGISAGNPGGTLLVRTLGLSFLNAGIRFYF